MCAHGLSSFAVETEHYDAQQGPESRPYSITGSASIPLDGLFRLVVLTSAVSPVEASRGPESQKTLMMHVHPAPGPLLTVESFRQYVDYYWMPDTVSLTSLPVASIDKRYFSLLDLVSLPRPHGLFCLGHVGCISV